MPEAQENTQTTPQQPTPEQGRAILMKLFQSMHGNLGAVSRFIVANPTPQGYLMATEEAGKAVTLLTRTMGMLEKIIVNSGGEVPRKPDEPGVANDGALIAAFAPAPAASTISLDDAFSGRKAIEQAAQQLQQMSVQAIETAPSRAAQLIEKHVENKSA